jgi:histidine triad (HIT) family protein
MKGRNQLMGVQIPLAPFRDHMDDCIFCKIVRGEIPSYKVYEDDDFLAFLDIYPNTRGMTLVIPKKHYSSYLFDLPDDVFEKLLLTAKKIGKILDKALNTGRTAMIVEGLETNHAHVKLYPLMVKEFKRMVSEEKKFFDVYPGYITSFEGPRADDKELAQLAKKIRESF